MTQIILELLFTIASIALMLIGGYLTNGAGKVANSDGHAIVIIGNLIAGTMMFCTGFLSLVLLVVF